jgi:hypothetical protein
MAVSRTDTAIQLKCKIILQSREIALSLEFTVSSVKVLIIFNFGSGKKKSSMISIHCNPAIQGYSCYVLLANW